MIKSELVKRLLNKNPHLIQRDVEMITSKIFEKMTDTLENEGRVEIRGFGSLSVRRRKAKNGQEVCLYKGANDTYSLVVEGHCPIEYQCKYEPGGTEPNIDSVVDSLNDRFK